MSWKNNYSIGGILAIMLISIPVLVKGQACPACSNPALQSSEKLEAGLDTLYTGAFRITLNVTSGNNYQGGHPNWKGADNNGQIVSVPLHQLNIELAETVNHMKLIEHKFIKLKSISIAAITNKPNVEMGLFWQSICQKRNFNYKVFLNYQDAENWILMQG